MNTEALFLFLILLLGLVLCSFLGGNCGKEGMSGKFTGTINYSNNNSSNNSTNKPIDISNNTFNRNFNNTFDNYNHFSGSSTQLTNGTTFYGDNGGTIIVSTDSNGKQTLQVKLTNNDTPITFNSGNITSSLSSIKPKTESFTSYSGDNGSAISFNGPNGEKATIIHSNDGQNAINIQTSNGSYTFTKSGSVYNPNNISSTQYFGSTGSPIQTGPSATTYTGDYGSASSVTGPRGNTAYHVEGLNGGSASSVTGPRGNTAYHVEGPNGNSITGTTNNSNNGYDYSSSLPPGIPRSQIPPGKEDLYILKSEVVPPVCPVCPACKSTTSNNDPYSQPKCPPCEPCGRCPEPSFECKKVPNYSAINNSYLPQPVLNNFSTFGM